jgi:plastocyanin domain-containing protein
MGIMINILGLILVGLIIWWFLIAKPRTQNVLNNTENSLDIIVENGVYEPALIRAKVGQTLELRFLRKDKSACSEVVIFDKLNVSAQLPINKYYVVNLTLTEPGEFEFTCQMGMYRGKLIVEKMNSHL